MQVRWTLFLIGALLRGSGAAAAEVNAHPLDPLSKEELAAAVEVLKSAGRVTDASRFPLIHLHEPPKQEVLGYQPGSPLRREAFAVVYERARNQTFEAVIDLNARKLRSWKEIPGVQPNFMVEDYALLQEIVRADPNWQKALLKRGIKDFDKVQLDPWSAGHFGFPEETGIRVFRAVATYRGDSKNPWARPIEGLVAYVDMNAKKVFKLVDSDLTPVAKATGEYDARAVGKMREAPRPLEIRQSQGASFTVHGNEARWQKWRFRFGMHPREGLVLHTVGYEDGGRLRPLLYRASLSEMVVPYGDPGPAWFFRNAFDEGEYGIGMMVGSLEPKMDAPENASFFDSHMADDSGKPLEIARAFALYERDGGLLWKHNDLFETKHNESRRARQLVVSWIATVGNYEYGFNWIFHQDGALEMDALLTGIMQTKGVSAAKASGLAKGDHTHGHLVAEHLAAVHHQHFFNFRLDLDVDGPSGNTVVERDTEALPPGPGNPYGNAFVMKESPLRTEREAQRQCSLAANRRWRVINPAMKNALGEPVGYLLVPGENSVPYADPGSSVRRRAGFVSAHLWVTPYDPGEKYAAGDYIYQSAGGEGLPKWTGANRSIENQDVVVWYTMGVTHMPRPEEWPVMPVHHSGFKLIPSGFFARNPALDVPKMD
ncbi:MAG: primary-amine oxidase [Gammaproteobacteria bacterium]